MSLNVASDYAGPAVECDHVPRPALHATDPIVNPLDQDPIVLVSQCSTSVSGGPDVVTLNYVRVTRQVNTEIEEGTDAKGVQDAIMAYVSTLREKVEEMEGKKEETPTPTPTPTPPVQTPTVSAGFLKMGRENRENKIDRLVPKHITPAAAKALKAAWCTDEQISLSLSSESDGGFDE